MFVLLEDATVNLADVRYFPIKRFHYEDEERYLTHPPENPNWKKIGTYETLPDVLSAMKARLQEIISHSRLPATSRTQD